MSKFKTMVFVLLMIAFICPIFVWAQDEPEKDRQVWYYLYPQEEKIVLRDFSGEVEKDQEIKIGDKFGQLKKIFGMPAEAIFRDIAWQEDEEGNVSNVRGVIRLYYKNLAFDVLYTADQVINGLKDEGLIASITINGNFWVGICDEDGSNLSMQCRKYESMYGIYRELEYIIHKKNPLLTDLRLNFELIQEGPTSLIVKCVGKDSNLVFNFGNEREKRKGLESVRLTIFGR